MIGSAMMDAHEAADGRQTHPMERWWVQATVVAVILAAFTVVFVVVSKREVVSHWELLATCAAPGNAVIERSTPTVDTSPCSTNDVEVLPGRGWPILTFALPSSAGLSPKLTGLTSNKETRAVELHFESGDSTGASDGGYILAFVEVPPGSLPPTPFTVRDEAGSTTVNTVRAT